MTEPDGAARLRERVMEAAEECGLTQHFHVEEKYRDPVLAKVSAALDAYAAACRRQAFKEAGNVMRKNGCASHAWIVENIEPLAEQALRALEDAR